MKCRDGGAGIGKPGRMVGHLAFMPAVENIQRRRDMEHDGERQAEIVGAVEHQLQPHDSDDPVIAGAGRQAEGGHGDGRQHDKLPCMMRHPYDRQGEKHHQEAWRHGCQKITHHRSNPRPASRSCEGRSRPRL